MSPLRLALLPIIFFCAIVTAALAQSIPFPGPGMPAATGGIGTPQVVGNFQSVGAIGNVSSCTGGTLSNSIASGDYVAFFAWANTSNSVTISSVSDGTNVYSSVTTSTNANTSMTLFAVSSATAVSSGATISATFSGAAGNGQCGLQIVQVSGVTTVDTSNIGSTASGTSLSIAVTPSSSTQKIIFAGGIENQTTTFTSGSGFTNLISSCGSDCVGIDYQKVATTSPVTWAPSWGATGRIVGLAAVIK